MLDRSEVQAVYDRIGRWQDTQSFYESPALDELIERGEFGEVTSVLEIGCGTGRFAERILRDDLPQAARYYGVDVSATMAEIARERLTRFGERVTVRQTDGRLRFDWEDGIFDRVVATYVLDLLSRDDAETVLLEAHRLLCGGSLQGRVCLAGLTEGAGSIASFITRLWSLVHALRLRWVGGCRPIQMRPLLRDEHWQNLHHTVITSWGVPSEVLVAAPLSKPER